MTTTSKLACPPRYGTTRTPERPTLGHAVAEVAALLGKPLMPWQRHVADVALEIDPDTGRLAYDEIGLTVPRQSGKSTLILAKAVHRATASGFFGTRQRLVYTAQTRNKAREKWEEDYAADLKASRTFGSKIRPHFGNGNEHIRFPNGSRFGIEANTEKAGHGSTLDEAYIDEAFAQADNRLEQAFRPAMITRPNTQLWWVSTAGWLDGSPYLLDKVTRGRQQAEMGMRDGLAYFEWSAPDDADVEDREAWRACMPALDVVRPDGSGITERAIEAELRAMSDTLNDFRRAYLNQWVLKDAPDTETPVDMQQWAELEHLEQTRPSPVAFSVEVSNDRKWSSIGLAGRRTDGNDHLQIVQAARGTGWVAKRLAELEAQWKPVATIVNASAPAASLIPAIEAAGVHITKVTNTDYALACAMFADAVAEGTVRHSAQPQVTASLAAARKLRSGQTFTFHGDDIAPLRAVVLALFGLHSHKKPKRSGRVW
jgi:phage terminase large subunit-like protein